MLPLANVADRVTAALLEITRHQPSHPPTPGRRFSITISREMGAGGHRLAELLGSRLGWPVFDHELLEQMAHDMHVRVSLLEAVDERHVSWLQERMEALAAVPFVSESGYARQLIETLLALELRGHVIVVGRGAAHVLSPSSTLNVRMVARLDDRVTNVMREQRLAQDAAVRLIRATDAQRVRFVRDHFQHDPLDPTQYDLVLNASRMKIDELAALTLEALARRQTAAALAG